jgi:gamma-glutamylcyclotransferase (GGCT)/AIG2-like uncharacterized protein YtfP
MQQNNLPPINRVFVYGTLKKGFENHYTYLRDAKFLKEMSIPAMMIVHGRYPGVILHRDVPRDHYGKNFIISYMAQGQLFEVDHTDGSIEQLDLLEGHPSFYKRVILDLAGTGEFYTYALDFKSYIHDKVAVVGGGVWLGDKTTVQEVDFFKGDCLPKIISTFSRDKLGLDTRFPVIVPPNYHSKRYDEVWEEVVEEIDMNFVEIDLDNYDQVKEA